MRALVVRCDGSSAAGRPGVVLAAITVPLRRLTAMSALLDELDRRGPRAVTTTELLS
ncbi:hypothetical protein [Streptomyces sp. NPDC018833]|uniref:hypothetical protein n=1 Tax=Streptomyces sp. NPDC018833 TaxID=3365053 RepID=UPI0037B2D0E2